MKKILTAILLFLPLLNFAQSAPVVLRPDISISRVMTVRNGVIRMAQDPISHDLFYVIGNGSIYKIIRPATGPAYDSLMYIVTDHGVDYPQCILFKDSTLFVCGNETPDDPMTRGFIRAGKLNASGGRTWRTVLWTEQHPTCGQFDHKFSGMVLTPNGDSLVINSGSRGDHGEVESRSGLYPTTRNVPLTSKIFIIPVNDSTYLHNDSTWLANSGYIYAEGVRNNYSMAYAANGRLFGLENSGDRDHNEEMNWLRRGHHYGFPFCMGDTRNPQQYGGYNEMTDLMINHYSIAWRAGAFHNDPAFPPQCVCSTLDEPIQNMGPDCDKFRDTITGKVKDASDLGISIGTFTAHRSPLGLVFDNDSIFNADLRGDAYMLSWTRGLDSTGGEATVYDTTIGPFVDPSEDLVHLHLIWNASTGKYTLSATRIISNFSHPVDAKLDGNKLYVIENDYAGIAGLYEVTMPMMPAAVMEEERRHRIRVYPNPSSTTVRVEIPVGISYDSYELYDSAMKRVGAGTCKRSNLDIEVDKLPAGLYFIRLQGAQGAANGKIIIQ
ncbi:MAG: T9SS type A sorting domain-containing protein [Bacteroidia bacterium]